MSTFDGIFEEIPSLSADRFDGENLKSKIFLLSHCHMDHMVGLDNPNGLPGPLYTSSVSKVFVCHQYPAIKNIITLDVGVPTRIEYFNDTGCKPLSILVTTISAGHCPGSIMFLLETHNCRVLYTGDFRMRINELKKVICLKSGAFGPLSFDAIYLDSTFFNKQYCEFPSQFDSAKEIVELVDEWLHKGIKNHILLKIPARYGSEFVFMEVARHTGMKIHVNPAEFQKYQFISEMDNAVTDIPHFTRIHACVSTMERSKPNQLKCLDNDDINLRVIRPSAMVWNGWHKNKKIVERVNEANEMYRVCYSSHASFTEIKDFLLYLKPNKCKLNVIPENEKQKSEMLNNLANIMQEYQKDNPVEMRNNDDFDFGNIRIGKKSERMLLLSDDDDSDHCDKNTLDIPLKRTKL